MNIEYIIPLVTFWNAISSQFSKYLPLEIANNAVCFIHSVSFIAHYNYDFNLNYTVHASIAFFIYDLFYILRHIFLFYRYHRDHSEDPLPHPLKYKDELNKKIPFIAHHIAAIYILYYAITLDNGYKIIDAFILLEKSNIMIYVSYHLHKQRREYTRINALSEFVQLMTYTYYRLFALSVFIYDHRLILFEFPYITQFMILLVCSMGYVWSYRLLKKNIANYGVLRSTAPAASAASRKYSSAG